MSQNTASGPVKKMGVLLVEGRHGVLSDMVRDVLEHAPGIEVVGDVTDIDDTSDAVGRTGCEAVVWIVPEPAAAVAPPALLRPASGPAHPRGRGPRGTRLAVADAPAPDEA